MTTNTKPNTLFWIIAVVALLWNLVGTINFISSTFLVDAMRDALPEEQMALMDALPSWYAIVFGVATVGGLLASLLLLMRKKAAIMFFLLSLVAVLIQMGYWLFATEVIDVIGVQAAVMPLLVIAISIFLYFYSKGAAQKGWIS